MAEPSFTFEELLEKFDIQGPLEFVSRIEAGLRTLFDLYQLTVKSDPDSLRNLLDTINSQDPIRMIEYDAGGQARVETTIATGAEVMKLDPSYDASSFAYVDDQGNMVLSGVNGLPATIAHELHHMVFDSDDQLERSVFGDENESKSRAVVIEREVQGLLGLPQRNAYDASAYLNDSDNQPFDPEIGDYTPIDIGEFETAFVDSYEQFVGTELTDFDLIRSDVDYLLIFGNNANEIQDVDNLYYLHTSGGNDTVRGSSGSDYFDGGEGTDTLTFEGLSQGIRVSSAGSEANGHHVYSATNILGFFGSIFGAEEWIDLFTRFENLTLTNSDDELQVDENLFNHVDFLIEGGDQSDAGDVIDGQDSGTRIVLNLENGSLSDGSGGNILTVSGFASAAGSAFNDVLTGTDPTGPATSSVTSVSMSSTSGENNGANILEGGAGNDQIDGLGGEDVLRGMAGDDVINGGPPAGANGNEAADRIEGGSGNDVISIHAGEAFGQSDNDMIAIFGDVADGPDGDEDPAVQAFGGSGNDILDARGSTGSHVLIGGSGDDIIYGNGNSVITAGSGIDEVHLETGDALGDRLTADDKLFVNGVEISGSLSPENPGASFPLPDGPGFFWGYKGIGGNFRLTHELQSGDHGFAVFFEMNQNQDAYIDTLSSVSYTAYIVTDVGGLEINERDISRQSVLDRAVVISDFHPGDFGLMDAVEIGVYNEGSTFINSFKFFYDNYEDTNFYLNSLHIADINDELVSAGVGGSGLPLGDPLPYSEDDLRAEVDFEDLTEEFSDEWLSAQQDGADGAATEQNDLFTGEGPSTSGGGGEDVYVLNASANTASGGADGDFMVGSGGNDTLSGDSGNDRIYGNDASGSALFAAFEGFGDVPVDPGGPFIPFDPPMNDSEQGYNDGYAIGFAEMGEITNPPPELPTSEYEAGYIDGYFAGFDAFFEGGEGGEGEEPSEEPPVSDDDHLTGGTGDDTIYGDRGNDLIEGNEDNDLLFGEDGNDTILGGSGTDRLDGGDGDDSLSGADGADEVIGGAGADAVNGGAGNDVVSGGAGNDEVSGGAGADTLSGGTGNDLIFGGEDNDSIDAGTGNDTVYGGLGDDAIVGGFGDHTYHYARGDGSDTILDGGPFAYQNTDRLVFSDIVSTEVQYRRDGDDFIVLLADGERITSERQFRPGNDGIEFLDFADGVTVEVTEGIVEDAIVTMETTNFDDGRVLVATYEDGVKTSATMTDGADAYAWSEYTDTFDFDGNRISRDTTYDDGREAQNTYVAGVIASSIITDLADEFVWDTVERAYDENGTQTGQTNTYDDGRFLETAYTDGVRASAEMTDVNNAYAWASYMDTFDANGDLALRVTTFDDGRVTETTSMGGVSSSSIVTDVEDAFVWDTFERGYDDMGMQITQINTYDDGRVFDIELIDGVRATGTMTDVADVYAWVNYVDIYDAEGALASRSMTYDDGRIAETTYLAGVQSAVEITDAGDAYAWSLIERAYDDGSLQIGQTTTYDDGRILATAYTGGIQSLAIMTDPENVYAWASYENTFDAEGALLGRMTVYDDGRETQNTYVDDVLTASFTSDAADQFVWNTIAKTFDGVGVLTDQTTTYDNGRVLDTLYSNGLKTTATMTDVADVYAWDNYVDTYNDEGIRATRLMTFDDGSEVFTDYLA